MLNFLDTLSKPEFQSQLSHELFIFLIGAAFSPVLAVILNYISSKILKGKEFKPKETFKDTAISAAFCYPLIAFVIIITFLIKYN